MPPKKTLISVKKRDGLLLLCEWGLCEEVITTMVDFQNHVGQHLKEFDPDSTFEQDGCLLPAAFEKEFEFTCKWRECGAEVPFQSFIELLRHAFFHAVHTKLKCKGSILMQKNALAICSLDAVTRNTIHDHLEPFRCQWDSCQAEYDSPYMFYEHTKAHVEIYPLKPEDNSGFPCLWQGCSVSTRCRFKLSEHLRSHTQEKVVACPTCGGMFANNTKMFDHIKRQGMVSTAGQDPECFQCSHCNKRFPTERILREHMRHHVNNYKCPLCEMTCPHPSALRQHIHHRHNQECQYECPQCEYTCKTAKDLRMHLISHQEKSIRCGEADCQYECRKESELVHHYKKKHIKDHTPNLYQCHMCKTNYTRGAMLTRHLKLKHNFKWPPGHKRFSYKLYEDGFLRLQTIRYESLELSEQLQREREKIAKEACSSSAEHGKTLGEHSTNPGSYNLEMLGNVAAALQLPTSSMENHMGEAPSEEAEEEEEVSATEEESNCTMTTDYSELEDDRKTLTARNMMTGEEFLESFKGDASSPDLAEEKRYFRAISQASDTYDESASDFTTGDYYDASSVHSESTVLSDHHPLQRSWIMNDDR